MGGSVEFNVHVEDNQNYGITVYHDKEVFVYINVPGNPYFPNKTNEYRTQIINDGTKSHVKVVVTELTCTDGGEYKAKTRHSQGYSCFRTVLVQGELSNIT